MLDRLREIFRFLSGDTAVPIIPRNTNPIADHERPDMEHKVELILRRDLFRSPEGSVGSLYLGEEFLCHILEDASRLPALLEDRSNLFEVLQAVDERKKYGKTRIPAGVYDIVIQKERGRAYREDKRYAGTTLDHDGIMELVDVPGFQYIQIHAGNDPEDTLGCLLPGKWNGSTAWVSASRNAYERLYKRFAPIAREGRLKILIVDGA